MIRDICTELVLHPKNLRVSAVAMSASFTIEISAPLADGKRIVGWMGSHFKAITSLVKAIAAKNQYSADVARVEMTGTRLDRYPEFKAAKDWPHGRIVALVERMARAVFQHEADIKVAFKDGSDAATMMDVELSEAEDAQLVAEMLTAFKTLVRPIGKAHGRIIYLNLVQTIAHEAQPDRADGRHAKQLER